MVVAEVTLLAMPCLSSMATWAMLFTWEEKMVMVCTCIIGQTYHVHCQALHSVLLPINVRIINYELFHFIQFDFEINFYNYRSSLSLNKTQWTYENKVNPASSHLDF